MNETYNEELQQEINFLFSELAFIQKELEFARQANDTDEYSPFNANLFACTETVFEVMRGTGKAGTGRK